MSIAVVVLVAAGAWAALGWLVSSFPPTQPAAQAGFYALLFLALASSVALALWLVRPFESGEAPRPRPFAYLSHGMVFSSLTLFALWLQSLRMLTLFNAALLLALFGFVELTVILGQRGGDD